MYVMPLLESKIKKKVGNSFLSSFYRFMEPPKLSEDKPLIDTEQGGFPIQKEKTEQFRKQVEPIAYRIGAGALSGTAVLPEAISGGFRYATQGIGRLFGKSKEESFAFQDKYNPIHRAIEPGTKELHRFADILREQAEPLESGKLGKVKGDVAEVVGNIVSPASPVRVLKFLGPLLKGAKFLPKVILGAGAETFLTASSSLERFYQDALKKEEDLADIDAAKLFEGLALTVFPAKIVETAGLLKFTKLIPPSLRKGFAERVRRGIQLQNGSVAAKTKKAQEIIKGIAGRGAAAVSEGYEELAEKVAEEQANLGKRLGFGKLAERTANLNEEDRYLLFVTMVGTIIGLDLAGGGQRGDARSTKAIEDKLKKLPNTDSFGETEQEKVKNYWDAYIGATVEKNPDVNPIITAQLLNANTFEESINKDYRTFETKNKDEQIGLALPSDTEVDAFVRQAESIPELAPDTPLTAPDTFGEGAVPLFNTEGEVEPEFSLEDFNLKPLEEGEEANLEAIEREGYEGVYYPLAEESSVLLFNETPAKRKYQERLRGEVKTAQLREHIREVRERVPFAKQVPVDFIENLYQTRSARGFLGRDRKISLGNVLNNRTYAHELFHAWTSSLSNTERNDLYDAIRKQYPNEEGSPEEIGARHAHEFVEQASRSVLGKKMRAFTNTLSDLINAPTDLQAKMRDFLGTEALIGEKFRTRKNLTLKQQQDMFYDNNLSLEGQPDTFGFSDAQLKARLLKEFKEGNRVVVPLSKDFSTFSSYEQMKKNGYIVFTINETEDGKVRDIYIDTHSDELVNTPIGDIRTKAANPVIAEKAKQILRDRYGAVVLDISNVPQYQQFKLGIADNPYEDGSALNAQKTIDLADVLYYDKPAKGEKITNTNPDKVPNLTDFQKKHKINQFDNDKQKRLYDALKVKENTEPRGGVIQNAVNLSKVQIRKTGRVVEKFVGTAPTNLLARAPSLWKSVREGVSMEENIIAKAGEISIKLNKAFKKLSDGKKDIFAAAVFEGNTKVAESVIGKDLYSEIRTFLNEVHNLLDSLGVDTKFLRDYFPRSVKDLLGFSEYLGNKKEFTDIVKKEEKKRGRKLTEDEKFDIVATHSDVFDNKFTDEKKFTSATQSMGFTKKRRINLPYGEVKEFYKSPPEAFAGYINRIADTARIATTIGKNGLVINDGKIDIQQSVEKIFTKAEIDGKLEQLMPNANENTKSEVRSLLTSILEAKRPPKSTAYLKSITSMTIMATPQGTARQISDVFTPIIAGGLLGYIKRLPKGKISQKDINITAEIRKHLDMREGISKKWANIQDTLYNVVLQQPLLNHYDQALSEAVGSRILKQDKGIQPLFETLIPDEAARKRIIKELQNKEIKTPLSDEARHVLRSIMSTYKPTHYIDRAEAELQKPGLAVFYQFRQYFIGNVYNAVRIHGFQRIKRGIETGDKEEVAKGVATIARAAAWFILSDAPVSMLLDLISNREIEDIPTYLLDSTLSLGLTSKYGIAKLGVGSVKDFALNQIAPPFLSFLDSVVKNPLYITPLAGRAINDWYFRDRSSKSHTMASIETGSDSIGLPNYGTLADGFPDLNDLDIPSYEDLLGDLDFSILDEYSFPE